MQRVQTGGDLHGLYLVDGLTGGIEGTAEVKWRTTIGVVVLNDQILYLFRIHEGRSEGVFLGLNIVVVLEAVGSKQFLDLLVRTWRNLVNHRPGEGNLCLVLQVVEEGSRYQTVVDPTLSIGKDTRLHFVAIV